MIVSCEHCRTQFRLDDSKVPEAGARVRCSKCSHSFFIPPPGQSDDLMAAEQAREALLGGRDELGDSDSDWEFNHDGAHAPEDPGPGDGRGLQAAPRAVDGLLGDLAGSPSEESWDPGEGVDPEGELDEGAGDEEPEALFGTLEDEFAPGTLEDDFTAGGVGEEPIWEDEPPGPAADPLPETGFENPESWDLLDEPGEPVPTPFPGAAAERPRFEPLAHRSVAEPARAADDGRVPLLARAVRAGVGGLGWLATLALLAVGAWGVIQPRPPGAAAVAGALQVPGFRALDVRGRWLENAVAGPLYVVSGRLRRTDEPATGGALAVRLLDARGEPLSAPATPLGPPLSERALREQDPDRLESDQRRAALELARLHPGETVPFQAVFRRVPPEAARFDLEQAPGS